MNLGEYIKGERKLRNITQRKLASKVGVNFSYISRIESGDTKMPSDEILIKISDALELDIDKVMLLSNKYPQELRDLLANNPTFLDIIKNFCNKTPTASQLNQIHQILEA